eukprot:6212688-Pleurochrysis_carterae.AAC.2
MVTVEPHLRQCRRHTTECFYQGRFPVRVLASLARGRERTGKRRGVKMHDGSDECPMACEVAHTGVRVGFESEEQA